VGYPFPGRPVPRNARGGRRPQCLDAGKLLNAGNLRFTCCAAEIATRCKGVARHLRFASLPGRELV
jgi:hypothetical protein